MLPTLQPKRLYKQIADLIASHIKSGEFVPGTYLPSERDLAHQLGVSRSSVREALIALEVSGLVEIRVGNGVMVLSPNAGQGHGVLDDEEDQDYDSPFQLIGARSLLEGEVAAIAAKNATPAQLAGIEETVKRMDEIVNAPLPLNEEALSEADWLFHMRIAEATGNYVLVELVEGLRKRRFSPIFRRAEKHFSKRDLKVQTVEDHRAVFEAIRAGDADAAREAMKMHQSHVIKRFSV
ncbi:MAG: GntR family transcriptional regulator [Proteobacteria bacterium]|nr:GntR family transcriptional regulator [Pseudomonadota bacterium]